MTSKVKVSLKSVCISFFGKINLTARTHLTVTVESPTGKMKPSFVIQGEDTTPTRPFVTENNVIMYLDMIHEKIAELKGVAQYLDWKKGGARTPLLSPAAVVAAQGKGAAAFKAAPLTAEQRGVKRVPSGGQLMGKQFSGSRFNHFLKIFPKSFPKLVLNSTCKSTKKVVCLGQFIQNKNGLGKILGKIFGK